MAIFDLLNRRTFDRRSIRLENFKITRCSNWKWMQDYVW